MRKDTAWRRGRPRRAASTVAAERIRAQMQRKMETPKSELSFELSSAPEQAPELLSSSSSETPRHRLHPPEQLQRFVVALCQFKQQEGHFVVPARFEIPKWWPEDAQRVPLGAKLQNFAQMVQQHAIRDPDVLACLQFMGFPMTNWNDYVWQTAVLPALKHYKKLHGDLLVPAKFVVPYAHRKWPRTTWSYSLGRKVVSFRQNRQQLPKDQVDALDEMGFVWNVVEWKWHHRVRPALQHYMLKYGHLEVPKSFEVAKHDKSWPAELRGIKLGYVVSHIRFNGQYHGVPGALEEMHQLGIMRSSQEKHWYDEVLPAFQTFHRLYGHSTIPSKFEVPSDPKWPPATWGLQLGNLEQKIRVQGSFKQLIAKDQTLWEEMGFATPPS